MSTRSISTIVVTLLLFVACSFSAAAGPVTSKRTFSIDFAADTKDFHFLIAGTLTNVSVAPDGPTAEQQNKNSWSGTWDAAPGAKKQKITVSRKGAGTWNFRYWLTTTGDINIPDVPPSGRIASLYIDPHRNTLDLFAENLGSVDVSITDITATIFDDVALLDSLDWDVLAPIGPTYHFDDFTVVAGASDVLLNCTDCVPAPKIGPNQWVRISATFDGVEEIVGSSIVPEPASFVLFCIGLLAVMGFWRAHHARKELLP